MWGNKKGGYPISMEPGTRQSRMPSNQTEKLSEGFLNLCTINILSQIILCCERLSCEISSIPRHCQMFHGCWSHPWLKISESEKGVIQWIKKIHPSFFFPHSYFLHNIQEWIKLKLGNGYSTLGVLTLCLSDRLYIIIIKQAYY